MDVDVENIFILNHRQYSCHTFDWRRQSHSVEKHEDEFGGHEVEDELIPFSLGQFSIERGEFYHDDYIPRISATYEFADEILYLKEITLRNKAFDIDFGSGCAPKKIVSRNGRLETYTLWMRPGFTGRLRLVRNDVKDKRSRTKNHVLDIILQDDRILNINDRSKEPDLDFDW